MSNFTNLSNFTYKDPDRQIRNSVYLPYFFSEKHMEHSHVQPRYSINSAHSLLIKEMDCCCSLLIWNVSLPVNEKKSKTKLTMVWGELLPAALVCFYICWIFFCSAILNDPQLTAQTHWPPPSPSPPPPTPKPRLFVTVVIARLNSMQYSPDPHPAGSLKTLRRYKRKQNSWPRPTHVSPRPPNTLYFKCAITWMCNYTHTHTHSCTHRQTEAYILNILWPVNKWTGQMHHPWQTDRFGGLGMFTRSRHPLRPHLELGWT